MMWNQILQLAEGHFPVFRLWLFGSLLSSFFIIIYLIVFSLISCSFCLCFVCQNFFTVDTFSISQAYPDASDEEDLVEIEDIEPYAAPGSILNRPSQPTAPGQTHTGDASRTKSVNPYDNVTDSPDEERRYLNVEEMREHERMSSCEYFWSCRGVRNQ